MPLPSIVSGSQVSLPPPATGGGGPAGAFPPLVLPFVMDTQTQTNWCWAAVTSSVARFYAPNSAKTQCQVVCAELNNSACCAQPQQCNQQARLDASLGTAGHLAGWNFGALPFASLQTEIQNGRPVCFRIQWAGGGGGHFVAVSGCDSQLQTVDVQDSQNGFSSAPYASFQSSYLSGAGATTHYYLTKP